MLLKAKILHTRSNFVLECQQKTTSKRQRTIYLQHLLCIKFLSTVCTSASHNNVQYSPAYLDLTEPDPVRIIESRDYTETPENACCR